METELKDLPKSHPEPSIDDGSNKDDRPLLKHTAAATASTADNSGNQLDIEELEKKYAAYVRRDVYGTMGRGELPWTEKVLLAVALVTLVPVRVVSGMILLLVYYLICRLFTLCLAPNREEEDQGQEDYAHMGGWRRAVILWSGRFIARAMLFVLGFYWIREAYIFPDFDNKLGNEAAGTEKFEEPERPGAIISNHVSHLDILYHTSCSFPSFVAKRSVGKLPLVGLIRLFLELDTLWDGSIMLYLIFLCWLRKCLGCVYVQRESKSSDFKGVSGVVNERVREAHQDKYAPMMMLFPEGTTTNGDFLLPFKTGAFLSKAPVLPVILRYPYQRLSPAWDSISGLRHMILLLCQFVNYMEVTRLPVYYPSQQEKDDPKLYADNVRELMAREGNLIMSDIGLAEKRIYHTTLNGLFSQR